MKTLQRKIFLISLCLVFIFTSAVTVYAESDNNSTPQRGPKYEFKTTYGKTFNKQFKGIPGNQPKDGFCFSTSGGSVNFSSTGGPTATLTASLGGIFGNISISTDLGSYKGKGSSVSGYSVNIPKNGFYRVRVYKTVKFKPYVTYRRTKGTTKWSVYTKGAVAVETVDIHGKAEYVKPCS